MNYATTVAALRERARAGLSLDESIVFLHDAGLPTVHSIKASTRSSACPWVKPST